MDDLAYDRGDPKAPGFAEQLADAADSWRDRVEFITNPAAGLPVGKP